MMREAFGVRAARRRFKITGRLKIAPASPDLNLYVFVQNDPGTKIDQFGLSWLSNLLADDIDADNRADTLPQDLPRPTTTNPGWGSAYIYGLGWVTGLADDAILGPDSPWTKDTQRSVVVNIDRTRAVNEITKYCQTKGPLPAPLRIQLGLELGGNQDSIPKNVYPKYFLNKLVYNSTEAFIGSWTRGNITVTSVDCCKRKASIHFHAVNVSGIASLFHKPPESDGTPNGTTYGASWFNITDNLFGDGGINDPRLGEGHNVSQAFDWDEKITF
ncbi:MAG: hypothetical protein ACXWJB_05625 [Limisphaerales bacterium]